MEKIVIAPRFMYVYGLIVHLLSLAFVSTILAIVIRTNNILAIVLVTFLFIIGFYSFLRFINKYVYFSILNKRNYELKSIFFSRIISIEDVIQVKKIWFNLYMLQLNDVKYYFYSSKEKVKTIEGIKLD